MGMMISLIFVINLTINVTIQITTQNPLSPSFRGTFWFLLLMSEAGGLFVGIEQLPINKHENIT
jgi:hypothetical protein